MNGLDHWIASAWQRHAEAPQAVADELRGQLDGVTTDADVVALAQLAQHVLGEHLAQWAAGQGFLMALQHAAGQRGALAAGGEGEAAIQRCSASLALCKGQHDMRASLAPAERIRATALAASAMAPHDVPRAGALFEQALALLQDHPQDEASPAHRTLAATGNNLACAMEERPARGEAETALMLRAAEIARVHWEKAGTWLNVERAEYRLARSWLASSRAGAADRARGHALECLRIVEANGDVALERFFGLEALALAERALGDKAGAEGAVHRLRQAFEQLSADDQAWCRASLDKLLAAP